MKQYAKLWSLKELFTMRDALEILIEHGMVGDIEQEHHDLCNFINSEKLVSENGG